MKKNLFSLCIAGLLLTSCIKQTNLFIDKGDIITFKFEKDRNPQLSHDIELRLYENGKIAGYLTENIDVSNLVATFSVERGKLYIDKTIQISKKTANDFSYPVCYTLEGENQQSMKYTVTLVPYTGLPVVTIYTANNTPLKDRENWLPGILEIDGMGKMKYFKDSIQVKGRGNGSWKYPKKPFNIKLNKKSEILNMPKHKRWSFLANYRDRTLLRNDVTFQLGYMADNLEWTPKSQFVEVIFNGEYQGNFQLCEQIRVDKNRVNIKELTKDIIEKDKITGEYLLEYDRYYDEVNRFKTDINQWPVNIKAPDEDELNSMQLEYIKNYTNTIEQLLNQEEFTMLYDEYIEINSFIDYWLVEALVGNKELSNIYSVYCYKDFEKKLCAGPLWDFDFTTFTIESGNSNTGAVWYKYLFKDPIFKNKVKQRFTDLKSRFTTIPQYIDKQSDFLNASVEANWKIWPIDISLFGEATLNKDETLPYQEAIERMKSIYQARLEWLETVINNL